MSREDALRRLERERAVVETDLAELAQQVATAEIDRETGRRLERAYRGDLDAVDRRILEVGTEPTRSAKRGLLGGAIVAVAFVGIGLFAAASLTPRTDTDPNGGATDLDSVSNEAMEAVIATNGDHPEINGMRLALADRYFRESDFRSALPHYMAVLGQDPTPLEDSLARGRVGWMFFQSGGEAEVAYEYLTESVSLNPSYREGQLYLAMVLLYGLERPAEALPILDELSSLPDLSPELRSLVDSARSEASA